MASEKTSIIERLFFERYDSATGVLSDDVVTLDQVSTAIREAEVEGGTLSPRNPANFLKDIVRRPNRNAIFPTSVVAEGWTARQDPGEGRCFRFIRLPSGQETAFLTSEPDPAFLENPHDVQSLSLPPASRTFGRSHETWLTHVVTNLGVVHTHFAINSPSDLIGLELLQSHVMLGKAEIDAIYLATSATGHQFLVGCEMKGPGEILDEDQIERGAQRMEETSKEASVLPMGVKALAGGLIWIVEFDQGVYPLSKVSEGVYRLSPPVPGVGGP